MTPDQLAESLLSMGEQKKTAARYRVSQTHMSMVVRRLREPSDRLLRAMGLVRVVSYEPRRKTRIKKGAKP